jgi:hypothetical protein
MVPGTTRHQYLQPMGLASSYLATTTEPVCIPADVRIV